MAIVVECPQCNTKAEVPDTAAGAKGKCRTCGAVVHVPGVRRKLCCSCGIDVTVSNDGRIAKDNTTATSAGNHERNLPMRPLPWTRSSPRLRAARMARHLSFVQVASG